jgi:pimeloyl-ACP methyl ester carboxylesterase
MLTVASSYDLGRFIAGGVSMGAATALYAALQAPDRMAGLLLVRPRALKSFSVSHAAALDISFAMLHMNETYPGGARIMTSTPTHG